MQGRVVVVEEGEEQEIEKGTLPSAVRSSERRQPRVIHTYIHTYITLFDNAG